MIHKTVFSFLTVFFTPFMLFAQETAATEQDGTGFMSAIEKAGGWMVPIVILALVALTLIIERTIFYIRTRAFNNKMLTEYLQGIANDSKSQYKEELEDELREATQVYVNRMEKGMTLLGGVGNLAPLLGFFGTVIGMIQAFADIAAATTVNAKVVAVGIQIALVTTAGGLAIAVPTLGFFHFFNHLVQKVYAHSDTVIADITTGKNRLSSSS